LVVVWVGARVRDVFRHILSVTFTVLAQGVHCSFVPETFQCGTSIAFCRLHNILQTAKVTCVIFAIIRRVRNEDALHQVLVKLIYEIIRIF